MAKISSSMGYPRRRGLPLSPALASCVACAGALGVYGDRRGGPLTVGWKQRGTGRGGHPGEPQGTRDHSKEVKCVWIKITPGMRPQVLVHVSTHQSLILGAYFDPQPNGDWRGEGGTERVVQLVTRKVGSKLRNPAHVYEGPLFEGSLFREFLFSGQYNIDKSGDL